jgi:hypothetical protein
LVPRLHYSTPTIIILSHSILHCPLFLPNIFLLIDGEGTLSKKGMRKPFLQNLFIYILLKIQKVSNILGNSNISVCT